MWTKEWPTEPGFYWFYGYLFRPRKNDIKKFYYFRVVKGVNTLIHTTNGFMYKAEGTEGYWQPVQFPELPKEKL